MQCANILSSVSGSFSCYSCTIYKYFRFEGITKNFKLYYDGQHYVGEKRFDTVQDLVADGLITFYLESKAADYIAALSSQSNYAESPYVAYNTHKKCCLVPRSKSGGSTGVTRSRNPSSGSGGSLGNRASLPVEGRVSKFSDSRHNVTIVSAPATIITPALSQTVLEQPAEGSTVIPDGCVSHGTNTDGPVSRHFFCCFCLCMCLQFCYVSLLFERRWSKCLCDSTCFG